MRTHASPRKGALETSGQRVIGAWLPLVDECEIRLRTHARVIGSIRNCGKLANFGGKFGRRTMRLGEMCLRPLPCSVWMKARGRWQFKWLTWTDIELATYCLLRITQTRGRPAVNQHDPP